jgi:hypothetical protein
MRIQYDEEDNFIGELNEAARVCPDVLLRKLLKDCAIEIDLAIKALCADATGQNLARLNGAWAHAGSVLEKAKTCFDPAPNGAGMREPARLAA